MPYDEEGRYIYPVPKKKSRPKAESKPTSPAPLELEKHRTAPTPPASKPPVTKLPTPEPIPIRPRATATPTLADLEKLVNAFTETELADLWNAQSWPPEIELKTTDGQPLKVVYRGRWSFGIGPDFKGAILDIGGELERGDVELHLRGQGWQAHGHHNDKHYNNVILHIALTRGEINTASGKQPPSLALLELFQGDVSGLKGAIAIGREGGTRLGSLSESEGPCCELVAERHPDLAEVLARIDTLGENRFLEKAEKYEIACAVSDENGEQAEGEAFWAGLLEALGYSQNKTAFRAVAQVLPLALVLEIEQECRNRGESAAERVTTLEAVILGAAGLLPTQRKFKGKPMPAQQQDFEGDPEDWLAWQYVEELERRWLWLERYLKAGATSFKPLPEQEWNFVRIRPVNHPSRRIAGLARWLVRQNLTEPADLIDRLTEYLPSSNKDSGTLFQVEISSKGKTGIEAESNQFWSRRYDLTLDKLPGSEGKTTAPALIGADRAAEVVVNVMLPFIRGYAQNMGEKTLAANALEAYRQFPRLGNNELTENVAKQVFRYWLEGAGELPAAFIGNNKRGSLSRLINGAMRQQGLIQLHHRFCAEQNWGVCPLA